MTIAEPSGPSLPSISGEPEISKEISKKSDIQLFIRAQQAMQAAARGERLQTDSKGTQTPATTREFGVKKTARPFDEKTRETAVQRAVSLLRTTTEYYGVTVGELDDEEKRLRTLSDERLRGTIRAYEFTSRHVGVILVDEKARDVAINKDAKIALFYSQHGASEDELNQMKNISHETQKSSESKNRRIQPN